MHDLNEALHPDPVSEIYISGGWEEGVGGEEGKGGGVGGRRGGWRGR